MKPRITVGLIGFGTVGTGVTKILLQNADLIKRRVGVPVDLVQIVDLDTTTDRGLSLPKGMLIADSQALLENSDVDIVVELIGGYEAAKRLILTAIANGKHVVTANKALLAVHGEEIFDAAARAEVDLGFEASVGGGIPVIRSLTQGLSANHLWSIHGIMNGTSNYILSHMTQEGKDFEEVLAQARRAGYAEADPTMDVEGIDSVHKLAIMVNLAYGTPVNVKEIYTEGITKISPLDIVFARELDLIIKLLGIAKCHGEELEARVHPTMIPATSPLAQVDGVYNAIHLLGDTVGDVVLYGQGAGSLPTASAVVSDVVDIARNILRGAQGRVPATSFQHSHRLPIRIRPIEEVDSMYYLRFMVLDQPGVLSQISGVLGLHRISISSVLQKGRQEGQTVPVVVMTYRASERSVQMALQEINRLPIISEPVKLIRVEEES